ncbi:hypothetical protein BgAZ_500600 [Babesia gibsoni]|uniref:Uncharacterized protein n=1 Tax=Babesia gibsoni TaxID=33632 RepID=A0AAD8LLP2_BABGI|nr:hypothetical protein BgAZ_500600 [Babesia gibsoni]
MSSSAKECSSERIFYRPDRELYSRRSKVINKNEYDSITDGWTLSESLKTHNLRNGSLLENAFPWQKKWYFQFDPPKSPEELDIGKHWRYDGPTLTQFIDNTAEKQSETPTLTMMPMAALKSMAVKILSGVTQESLLNNAYQKSQAGKGSIVSEGDGAGSLLSYTTKAMEGQSKQKRSILEGFKTTKTKGK